MGSCCSAPAEASVSSKFNSNAPRPIEVEGRCSATVHPVKVLNDPTGSDVVNRYTMGGELGRGEFGITRQCTDIESGVAMACKTIPKSKLRTEIDVEDVRREVEIMKLLPEHPNIVRLKDTYEDVDAVHLVMELCEGGELFDRIVARGHYTERAAASVIRTIMEVVQVLLFSKNWDKMSCIIICILDKDDRNIYEIKHTFNMFAIFLCEDLS